MMETTRVLGEMAKRGQRPNAHLLAWDGEEVTLTGRPSGESSSLGLAPEVVAYLNVDSSGARLSSQRRWFPRAAVVELSRDIPAP